MTFDTRATLDTKETFGTWNFDFTDKDNVVVGNSTINDYYTFTKSGDTFSSTDAKVTSSDADWYAYYPATDINLTNQEGTEASAAKLYALAGATETATNGANGLTINMTRQAAVLRIVKVDNYGPCDIFLKTTGGYVKGLKAKKNKAGYEVEKSESQVSVFKKDSNGNAGIYYVIVPVGVYLEVWNDTKLIKKTKANGLNAGKYYTLTSGPTTGTATAKLANGTTEKVEWVQLWYGGPRFATKNVADKMTWFQAIKKGDEYIWGANWRTPSKEELAILEPDDGSYIPTIVKVALSTDNGVKHFKYTGTQPGYISNNMIIPFTGTQEVGTYWTSTEGKVNIHNQETGVNYNISDFSGVCWNKFNEFEKHNTFAVRPVLTIQTVKWDEQDIQ